VTVPFSPVEGEFRAQQIAIDPDGTAYVVPSGMHERLRQAVASDREERDPKGRTRAVGMDLPPDKRDD